jgi:hypothetical protein
MKGMEGGGGRGAGDPMAGNKSEETQPVLRIRDVYPGY